MKRLLALVSVLLSSFAFADGYAAIAYSPSTGLSGTAWYYGAQCEAEQSAVGYCGQSDCTSRVWVRNACAALAVSSNGATGWAWNTDRGVARVQALEQCEGMGPDCHIVNDVCT